MTAEKLGLVRRAMALLRVALEEPGFHEPAPVQTPVESFVRGNFMRDPACDYSCAELWEVYQEAVGTGEVPPMTKLVFWTRLPIAMERAFGIRRSHNVRREGRRVRGFKGLAPRPLDLPITAAELELPIEPEIVCEPDLEPEPITEPWPATIVDSPVPRI